MTCHCKCHLNDNACCENCKKDHDMEKIHKLIWQLDAKYCDAFKDLSTRLNLAEFEIFKLKKISS